MKKCHSWVAQHHVPVELACSTVSTGQTYATVQVSAVKKEPSSALGAQLWGVLRPRDAQGFG